MKKEEKLYEVLGELLYTVAIADGVIQAEERTALQSLFKKHPYGKEVRWSFEYEENRNSTLEETYNKVINFCHGYGPTSVYTEFIKSMQLIAEAADGVDPNESKVMQSFSADLIKRFKKDTAALLNYNREERD